MTGAGGEGTYLCPVCNMVTVHSEWWESREPNSISVSCQVCNHNRNLLLHPDVR